MADYNTNDIARLKHLKSLAQLTRAKIDELDIGAGGIKSAAIVNGKLNFYATADKTGDVIDSVDIPEEIFLDQTGTTLVENFAYSALTYPGSVNPNLDGKTVLVLAVRGDAANPTVKYSFVNLEKLVDTYTAADNSIVINEHSIAVNFSAANGNAASLANDGVFVDISGKVDKVAGKQLSTEDYTSAEKTKLGGISAGAEVNVIESVKVDGNALAVTNKAVNIDLSGKVDKVAAAVTGNIVTFGASGAIQDGGFTFASDSAVASMLGEVFGAGALSSVLDVDLSTATSLQSGLMSAQDKIKLDSFTFASDSSVVDMINDVFGAGSISSIARP